MGNKSIFKILNYDNYLNVIKKSQGSKIFQNFYVEDQGKKKDILKKGKYSCARYVSSILKIFNLIDKTHATVSSTVIDMEKLGWQRTKKMKAGNILVWEKKLGSDKKMHLHIGFYFGEEKAISHWDKYKVPAIHHYTFGKGRSGKPKRKIISIYKNNICWLSHSRH